MLYLGPYFSSSHEHSQYAPLFRESLDQSIYLSVLGRQMVLIDRHYAFGTSRHFTEVTRDEKADIASAMCAAREAFLQHFGMIRMTWLAHDLRSVLARSHQSFPEWVWRDVSRIAKSMRDEVESGNLIFVPTSEDLRACVKAIQADRKKQSARSVRPERRVPQSLAAPPLPGEAQPLDYLPDELSGDVEQVASSTNNPKYAAKMLGYDQKRFGDILHDFKPDNGLGPADNIIWHDNGDVYFNGNFVANFHDWAN